MVIELSGAIWSEIVRDLRTQVLFQTKIAPLKFNYHLITAILKKGRIHSVLIFGLVAGLLKSASKKAFTYHFVTETEIMQYPDRAKWRGLRKWMTRFRTDVIYRAKHSVNREWIILLRANQIVGIIGYFKIHIMNTIIKISYKGMLIFFRM